MITIVINLTTTLVGMNHELMSSSKEHDMMETNFKQEREHGDEMPYPIELQIDIVV